MTEMRTLIDGHNLIPYVPGLNLNQMEDEGGLVAILQDYARQSRNKLEVFFDGAPPGKAGVRTFGTVIAHFVSASTTADHAIRLRLAELGAQARETQVVSSDRQVQAEARSRGARVVNSMSFARELVAYMPEKKEKAPKRVKPAPVKPKVEPPLPPDEVQGWLDLFGNRKK